MIMPSQNQMEPNVDVLLVKPNMFQYLIKISVKNAKCQKLITVRILLLMEKFVDVKLAILNIQTLKMETK